MPIPPDILRNAKDLLRLPLNTADWDVPLNDAYLGELDALLQATDWFFETETLDAVATQRRYVAQPRMTRIVSVFCQDAMLGKVTNASLDILRPGWQAQAPGTKDAPGVPSVWWAAEVPDTTVTPQVFFLHPAPVADVPGGLLLYEICSPVAENPAFAWIRPLLTYLTVAAFREGGHPLRDATTAAFFRTLSQLWVEVIGKREPR